MVVSITGLFFDSWVLQSCSAHWNSKCKFLTVSNWQGVFNIKVFLEPFLSRHTVFSIDSPLSGSVEQKDDELGSTIWIKSRNGSNRSQVHWLAVKLLGGEGNQQYLWNKWKGQNKCFYIIPNTMRASRALLPFFECCWDLIAITHLCCSNRCRSSILPGAPQHTHSECPCVGCSHSHKMWWHGWEGCI